ncbi:hypothetical protein H6F98_01850 [Microcoleus sp. FACHB-SPT15]|nr:hypothetical protein [Microcoleus sp. FACHB-SPT15]
MKIHKLAKKGRQFTRVKDFHRIVDSVSRTAMTIKSSLNQRSHYYSSQRRNSKQSPEIATHQFGSTTPER